MLSQPMCPPSVDCSAHCTVYHDHINTHRYPQQPTNPIFSKEAIPCVPEDMDEHELEHMLYLLDKD